MKLITLNIWGGKILEPLLNFFEIHADTTDFFCLQEVFNNPPGVRSMVQDQAKEDIYQDIAKILHDFEGFEAPTQDNEEELTMFIKKNIDIKSIGDTFVHRWKNAMKGNDASTYGINLQHTVITHGKKDYFIANLHGHWTPDFKGDNEARLEQSRNIKKVLETHNGPKILCGDFNIAPDTESMKILESSMINLVKTHNIPTTRSHYYKKKNKFADYIMVSDDIKVKKFEAMQDVVSDHLPLMLEFE